MDAFSWITLELNSDSTITVEHSEDFDRDGLIFAIGKYKIEIIDKNSFKIFTEVSLTKAKKIQDKITEIVQNEFFVLA